MESSPESFYYAVEGYYDKEDKLIGFLRLQTFHIVTSVGGKKEGGGPLKITDLWRLNSDPVLKTEHFKPTPEWFASVRKAHNIK